MYMYGEIQEMQHSTTLNVVVMITHYEGKV